jgi:choline dehydrogenase
MVYNRGFAPDYDALSELGIPGWDWQTVVSAYKAVENHELGESEIRGAGGPLDVTVSQDPDETSEAMLTAAGALGMTRHADLNASDDDRVGYTPRTIKSGMRVSAASAFLRPVRARENLTVATGTTVREILFASDAAVGVRAQRGTQTVDFRAAREVIICAGGIATPQLLQLSGIGPEALLREVGVSMRVDSPLVGERMLEHRAFTLQARLRSNIGYNRMISTPLRQGVTGARYLLNRRGPLSTPAFDMIGFLRTRPEKVRPGAQLHLAPNYADLRSMPDPRNRLPVSRSLGMPCARRATEAYASCRQIRASSRASRPITWTRSTTVTSAWQRSTKSGKSSGSLRLRT